MTGKLVMAVLFVCHPFQNRQDGQVLPGAQWSLLMHCLSMKEEQLVSQERGVC